MATLKWALSAHVSSLFPAGSLQEYVETSPALLQVPDTSQRNVRLGAQGLILQPPGKTHTETPVIAVYVTCPEELSRDKSFQISTPLASNCNALKGQKL